jgi:hypothetical protein
MEFSPLDSCLVCSQRGACKVCVPPHSQRLPYNHPRRSQLPLQNPRSLRFVSGSLSFVGPAIQILNSSNISGPPLFFVDLAIHVLMFGLSISVTAVLIGRREDEDYLSNIGGNIGVMLFNLMGMTLSIVANIDRARGVDVGWVGGNAMGWLIAGTGLVANANDEAVFLVEVLKLIGKIVNTILSLAGRRRTA